MKEERSKMMALTVFGPKYKDRIESIVKYIFIAIL